MPILTSTFIQNALSLPSHASSTEDSRITSFSGMTTDSRKITPGSLFIALKGAQDGHAFIEKALSQGATGILFQRGAWHPSPAASHTALFEVEDSTAAYRKLAAAWRLEFSIPVVVVAGSAGKTTVKELLSAILQGKWTHILKTQGSQNGYDGIPYTLLGLRPEHQAAVIEVGIDEIGAMQNHIAMVSPSFAVLTSIGPEHLESLIDVPTVAQEESLALSHCAALGGWIAISQDDPWIKPLTRSIPGDRKILFSLNSVDDPFKNSISGTLSTDGSTLSIQGQGVSSFSLSMPLPGKHNASNLLAAVSVALGLGLTSEEIKKGLTSFKAPEGRSIVREILTTPRTRIICDYYNAQPPSMKAGLELLSQISRQTRTENPHCSSWACLGDMLELGTDEYKFHKELSPLLCQLKVDHVLLFGNRMKALSEELHRLKAAGQFLGTYAHFLNHPDLSTALHSRIQPGDVVLIKGSRGMKMETLWENLQIFIQTAWSTPL